MFVTAPNVSSASARDAISLEGSPKTPSDAQWSSTVEKISMPLVRPKFLWLDRPWLRRIPLQRKMRSRSVIVIEIQTGSSTE